ncbi:MAG: hypothetical protein IKE92_14765 [Clostridiales bacterium]|nr:hypothetical protein [Clostridiales bacterium]
MNKNIEELKLKDTVTMMVSDDYKDRLRAEFWQTFIRYRALSVSLNKWDHVPYLRTQSRSLLEHQADLMAGLLYIYMKRSIRESIDLFQADFSPFPTFKDPLESLKEELEEKKTGFFDPPFKDPSDPLFRRDSDIGRGTHA